MDGDFSFGFVAVTDDESARPHTLYSVFSHPASDRDEPARSWAEGMHAGLSFTLLKDDARLLLAGVASGDRRSARMGENAYACEHPGGAELEELTLRLADGAVETVQLP